MCFPSGWAVAFALLAITAVVSLMMLAGPLGALCLLCCVLYVMYMLCRIEITASHIQHTAAANFVPTSFTASRARQSGLY